MSPYWHKFTTEYIKGREETNLLCRILNNICREPNLKLGKHNPSFLKCGLCLVPSFQKAHSGKGRKEFLQRRNLMHPQPGVNINCDKSCWQYYSWHDAKRKALHLCGLPLKSHNPSLIMRKEKHQINPKEGHFTGYPTNALQNRQGHQKQGKLKKLSQAREASGDIMIKRTAGKN